MHTHADGTRHHDHDVDHDTHDRNAPEVHGPANHSPANHSPANHGPANLSTVNHSTVNHKVRGGPPVLDIGGDIGAMVVLMDPATAGTELHLRSTHEPPIAVHTGVWTRSHGPATVTAAVFPELIEGDYWVLDAGGHDVQPVVIEGGELTEIDLRV